MNKITQAAWMGVACSFLAASASYAQVPASKNAFQIAKALSAQSGRIILPVKPEFSGYLPAFSAAKAIQVNTAQYAPVFTKISPRTVKVNKEKLKEVFLKKQAEKNKKDRMLLVANILLQKQNLLRGYHLPEEYLEGFFMKRIFPYQSAPRYIADQDAERILFRGMLLTPEELIQILKKGFSPDTSKWNAGTDGRAAISLSSSSVEASHYIFQSGSKKNGIGVVFEIRRKPSMLLGADPVLNRTKTIYYSYEDIAPEDIVNVLVRGEYGLENIKDIFAKAKQGNLQPHQRWTGQFGRMLF